MGDLSSIEHMRSVAEQANACGRFDAVIHSAGVGYREPQRIETVDGLAHVFAINVLADGQRALSGNFARPGAASRWDDVPHRRSASGSR